VVDDAVLAFVAEMLHLVQFPFDQRPSLRVN
jgi:hypothetical protein